MTEAPSLLASHRSQSHSFIERSGTLTTKKKKQPTKTASISHFLSNSEGKKAKLYPADVRGMSTSEWI